MQGKQLVLAAGLAVLMLGAAVATGPAQERSLYQRLGGYDAIAAVVDDFLNRALGDPKIARFFVGHSTDSKERFRQHLVEQVCMLAGGPCVYTGRTMKASHAGLGVTGEEWDLALRYLTASLDHYKVPEREKGEVIGALSKSRPDIVEK